MQPETEKHDLEEMTSAPFSNSALVTGYENWYQGKGRRADRLEKALLSHLLDNFPQAASLLEVGCGTGHFTRWFNQQGLQTVGLDTSWPMLIEAVHLESPPCMCGSGVALPFPDGAFDLLSLITTLEFISDPILALAEALRVAKEGLLLGVLNRHSVLGWQLKRKGGPTWDAARFSTPAELALLAKAAAGRKSVTVVWQTTLWPLWARSLPLPWGGFIGMAVKLE